MPSEPRVRLDVAAATRRGGGHSGNWDCFRILEPDPVRPGGVSALYAVCDGVSTTPEGRWAAQTTCEMMRALFEHDGVPTMDSFTQLLNEIDWEIRGQGMGRAACTMVALLIEGNRAHVVSVGDSVVYRVRHGRIRQVAIPPAGGLSLRTFMGMGPRLNASLSRWQEPLFTGDLFLLATDGVLDVMRAEEFVSLWWSGTGGARQYADQIIAQVDERRAVDDATVLVIDVLEAGADTRA